MQPRQHQRHVAAVGAAGDPDAGDIQPGVGPEVLDTGDVVETVHAAPIAVDMLDVLHPVPRQARTLGTNTANPFKVRYWISGMENQVKSGLSCPGDRRGRNG